MAGVTFAITPIMAQLYGAKEYSKIGYKLGEVLWISISLGLLFLIIYPNLYILVNMLQLESEVARIAGETAPAGRTMGHAGAIVGGSDDTAQAKKRII